MKRRMIALVLFLGAITSRAAIGETWVPGTPKPIPTPETWVAQIAGFFSDFWTNLMF